MDKPENSRATSQGKSKFITYFAWMFIVVTGVGTFIALIQNIIVSIFFPVNEMKQLLNNPEIKEYIPAILPFIVSHIRFFLLVYFVVAAAALVASIGLLKRKNWARIFFIGMMSLSIIWNLAELFFYRAMMPKIPAFPDDLAIPDFQSVFSVLHVFSVIFALGLIILYAWIIKKLVSKSIKQEFTPLEISNGVSNTSR